MAEAELSRTWSTADELKFIKRIIQLDRFLAIKTAEGYLASIPNRYHWWAGAQQSLFREEAQQLLNLLKKEN